MSTSNSSIYFYIKGRLLGLRNESDEDVTPTSTMKLYGTFTESDLSNDGDELSLLPSQFHIAIAYKVLALISGNPQYFEAKYRDELRKIAQFNNRLSKKRRIRQYDY